MALPELTVTGMRVSGISPTARRFGATRANTFGAFYGLEAVGVCAGAVKAAGRQRGEGRRQVFLSEARRLSHRVSPTPLELLTARLEMPSTTQRVSAAAAKLSAPPLLLSTPPLAVADKSDGGADRSDGDLDGS